MTRRLRGLVVFVVAMAVAGMLYVFTCPAGVPWGVEGGVRGAHALPVLAAALGAHALPLCAVAAGLVGAIFNRYFGWKVGVAAAVAWTFFPWVWNGAILGEPKAGLAALGVAGLWVLNAIVLWVTRKARPAYCDEYEVAAAGTETRGEKIRGIVAWVVLGAALVFALAAFLAHDYNLGEVASAYARLVVDEAGDRVILLNGLCDDQILAEVGSRVPRDRGVRGAPALPSSSVADLSTNPGTRDACPYRAISFENTEENCSNLVAWVKREWPAETNLWLAAEVGPGVFADVAVKAHPERFYSMQGQSTTPEAWAARWDAMTPYLASRDRFVPALRRQFAYEGNALGNALQEKGELKAAWELYLRVFREIHPGNPAACVNLNEMLRRGYTVDRLVREQIESAQKDYAQQLWDRKKAMEVAARIAQFGPVMRDPKVYEELQERIRRALVEQASSPAQQKNGDNPLPIPDLKTLETTHAEMMKAFRERRFDEAVRLARTILSRPAWRGFIPAHMVMGEAMMMKGDWTSAEAFLRSAVEAKGAAAPPPFVLNDYAETLRQLKRYGEAESYARRAVAATDAKEGWLFRLTLAQVLKEKGAATEADEVKSLAAEVLKNAPKEARKEIRKEFPQR